MTKVEHPRVAGSVILCLAASLLPGAGQATESYFALGYSPAARGVAGAGVAYSQDAMSGAINPASVATVGRELSFGFQAFSPSRGYTGTGTAPIAEGEVNSGKEVFPVPNMAYNLPLSNGAVVNFSAYGNGGMSTSDPAVTNAACGGGSGVYRGGEAGVDLTQLFLSVTYAQKPGRFSYGIAPTVAVQAFEEKGIVAFLGMSVDPAALTDNGLEFSYGLGLRLGMQYELSDQWTLGLAAQTEFDMSELDDYAGLFEGGGDFDIPASVTVGLAYTPTPDLALMLDYQKFFYSEVPAVGNAFTAGALATDGGGVRLG